MEVNSLDLEKQNVNISGFKQRMTVSNVIIVINIVISINVVVWERN